MIKNSVGIINLVLRIALLVYFGGQLFKRDVLNKVMEIQVEIN